MTPLRAHKAFITAITSLGDIVISGDADGSVRAWLLDPKDYEDGDPDTVELYRFKKWQRENQDEESLDLEFLNMKEKTKKDATFQEICNIFCLVFPHMCINTRSNQ